MTNLNSLLQEAQSETTDPERLWELATEELIEVRRACVLNSRTPVKALYALAAEFPSDLFENPTIQRLILERGDRLFISFPKLTLETLSECVDSSARSTVRRVQELLIDQLVDILKSPDCPVESLVFWGLCAVDLRSEQSSPEEDDDSEDCADSDDEDDLDECWEADEEDELGQEYLIDWSSDADFNPWERVRNAAYQNPNMPLYRHWVSWDAEQQVWQFSHEVPYEVLRLIAQVWAGRNHHY